MLRKSKLMIVKTSLLRTCKSNAKSFDFDISTKKNHINDYFGNPHQISAWNEMCKRFHSILFFSYFRCPMRRSLHVQLLVSLNCPNRYLESSEAKRIDLTIACVRLCAMCRCSIPLWSRYFSIKYFPFTRLQHPSFIMCCFTRTYYTGDTAVQKGNDLVVDC